MPGREDPCSAWSTPPPVPSPHLLLFDELFRGTNAVEWISASEAVLRILLERGPHVVVAATHDLELVDLLRDVYGACRFGDEISANALTFDYKSCCASICSPRVSECLSSVAGSDGVRGPEPGSAGVVNTTIDDR